MKILYDYSGFIEHVGGVSRYYTELVKHLPHGVNAKFSVKETRNVFLQAPPFNIPPSRFSQEDFLPWFHIRGKSSLYMLLSRIMPWFWHSAEHANEKYYKGLLHSDDFDILHITTPHPMFDNWSRAVGKKPIVTTVVDLIPDMLYGNRRVRHFRKRLLAQASHVIAISENTKQDIMKFYATPEDKISVIHLGFSLSNKGEEQTPFHGMRYILYVGKRGGYKNFDFFVKSIAPLLCADKSLNVVCTGSGFSQRERAMLIKEGVFPQVHCRFIPDSQMKQLFADAICFVYPSRYEGFGIPVLDAFAAGCPVVLAEASCFPEIAGDAALYFKLDNRDQLRKSIDDLASNHILRQKKIGKGFDRLKLFSWEKCAKQTMAVYEDCLSDRC